jgi:hypothetical protein
MRKKEKHTHIFLMCYGSTSVTDLYFQPYLKVCVHNFMELMKITEPGIEIKSLETQEQRVYIRMQLLNGVNQHKCIIL